MKNIYEEALNDMKKLREVAEASARNTIIDSLAPKLKDLIEKNLNEGLEDDELDEDFAAASGVVAHPEMTGATSGTGEHEDDKNKDDSAHPEATDESYEVTESSHESLFHLSSIAGPALSDRVVAEVYRVYDSINEMVTGRRQMDSDELKHTIRKIEDIYSYLQENSIEQGSKLEEKLETCYSMLNSFRETKMKMKDLVSADANVKSSKLDEDKDVTLRISGLPDDIELENLNIDIISDEDEMDTGAPPEGDAGMGGEEPSMTPPPAGPPGGMGEAEDHEEDESACMDEDDDMDESEVFDDNTVVEVSIPMLRKAIKDVREARTPKGVSNDVLDNFGGGKAEGDPWLDSDMERLGESEDSDDVVSELQNRRKRDEKGREQADNHLKPESYDRMLKLASNDVRESKQWYMRQVGTKNEATARKMVERAAKRFERIKEMADRRLGPSKKVDENGLRIKSLQSELTESKALGEDLRKQLAEVNLLNSKLIHANKLLQREGLTRTQKVTVIDRLDEAENLREVKLIYENFIRVFEDGDKGSLKEGASRRIRTSGSSSRATASSEKPVVSEGMETARWLELAGLSKLMSD